MAIPQHISIVAYGILLCLLFDRMKSLLLFLVLVTLVSCERNSELILIYIINYVKQNEVFVTPSGSGYSGVLFQ